MSEIRRLNGADDLLALPPGAVVYTYSPRLVPNPCVWLRGGEDAEGTTWWHYGGDDSFNTDDVLYLDPEIVLLLWHPDWAKEFPIGALNA